MNSIYPNNDSEKLRLEKCLKKTGMLDEAREMEQQAEIIKKRKI